jgi:acetyltransferase EpsM
MRYVLIGAGGQASEILPDHYIFGYVVDREFGVPGSTVDGKPILGDPEWLSAQIDIQALCAVGYPQARYDLVKRCGDTEFFIVISDDAIVSRDSYVGKGSIIAAGSIVMNDVRVGKHVLLNIASSVSHGSKLGDFCTLSPGARVAGNCTLGKGVFLGMNAVVIENITIGDWAKIGAGAVVLHDVPAGATIVGVPGRIV